MRNAVMAVENGSDSQNAPIREQSPNENFYTELQIYQLSQGACSSLEVVCYYTWTGVGWHHLWPLVPWHPSPSRGEG